MPNYLKFTATDTHNNTNIQLTVQGDSSLCLDHTKIYYSVNSETDWQPLSSIYQTIELTNGEYVCYKYGDVGTAEKFSYDTNNYYYFWVTGKGKFTGNIMSLIDGSCQSLVIPNDYCFCKLFDEHCYYVEFNIELPATTLKKYCYARMFHNCKSLIYPPELPATTLQNYCYTDMFYGCSELIDLPKLPSNYLSTGCYMGMFKNCTKIKLYSSGYRSWSLPSYGEITEVLGYSLLGMFAGTGGDVTSVQANTTYYLSDIQYRANKVIVNDNVLIDLTNDTVTPDKLLKGYTAHDASGKLIVGTLELV